MPEESNKDIFPFLSMNVGKINSKSVVSLGEFLELITEFKTNEEKIFSDNIDKLKLELVKMEENCDDTPAARAKFSKDKADKESEIKKAKIEYLQNSILWYRGQAFSSWKLNPSIYDDREEDTQAENNAIETKILSNLADFKRKSYRIEAHQPAQNMIPNRTIGWLSIMQHYNVETNLLDWTEFPLFSLLFAIDSFKKMGSNLSKGFPTVWILKPYKMNTIQLRVNQGHFKTYFEDGVIENRIPTTFELTEPGNVQPFFDYHFNIYPHINSNRLLAQHGAFTIFPVVGKHLTAMELCPNSEQYLYKVLLEDPEKILKELTQLGITKDLIYPSLND